MYVELLTSGGGSGPGTDIQKGTVALVAGTQSYAIAFSGLVVAPTLFGATLQMVDVNGEAFFVVADLSTLTNTGVTVYLSGVPTSASNGSFINWYAAA